MSPALIPRVYMPDVTTKTRHIDDLNEPSALVELELSSTAAPATPGTSGSPPSDAKESVVRFELDREALAELQAQCTKISTIIAAT